MLWLSGERLTEAYPFMNHQDLRVVWFYILAAKRLWGCFHKITLVIGRAVLSDLDKKFFELPEVQNAIDTHGMVAIYVIREEVVMEEVD